MSHSSEFDSHGHKDHGHVIVPLITLRMILGALLFFTLLTVGAAIAEQWLASVFQITIPQWINVFVALSIAVVKTCLVVMFFMQLKYDNPMNTAIFVFTVLTAACFLGFTTLDLGNRSTIDRIKAKYVIDGGSGLDSTRVNIPITQVAEEKAMVTAHDGHAHEAHAAPAPNAGQSITNAGFYRQLPEVGSSSNISRPVEGVTIKGLPGYVDPHAAKPHAPAHAEPEKADPKKADSPQTH